MDLEIKRSVARGTITAPPSKSMAHRHIICAALADGTGIVRNVDLSQDIAATLDCIRALGAKAEVNKDTVTIEGIGKKLYTGQAGTGGYEGEAAKVHRREDAAGTGLSTISAHESGNSAEIIDFPCRESGSTMRFFMAIAMLIGRPSRFFGSPTLLSRPFGVYEDICKKQGITFEKKEDHIFVEGRLTAGEYELPGNVSSQFITGLLFVLPFLEGDSRIKLIPPVESGSYIDLTISALKAAGVTVERPDPATLVVRGGQSCKVSDITVEGDYSNAAFLDAFNAIGGEVKVEGLSSDSLQGDRVYQRLFKELKEGHPTIDISDCPDLGPVLFAVAAANNGGYFTGTKRLKIKESNRGLVMCEELARFGIRTDAGENYIDIKTGGIKKPESEVLGHNDHRIVMSMALLLSLTGGKLIGAEAVSKSYPGFFEDIISLGIEVL